MCVCVWPAAAPSARPGRVGSRRYRRSAAHGPPGRGTVLSTHGRRILRGRPPGQRADERGVGGLVVLPSSLHEVGKRGVEVCVTHPRNATQWTTHARVHADARQAARTHPHAHACTHVRSQRRVLAFASSAVMTPTRAQGRASVGAAKPAHPVQSPATHTMHLSSQPATRSKGVHVTCHRSRSRSQPRPSSRAATASSPSSSTRRLPARRGRSPG